MAADSQRKTAQTACWAVTMTKVRIRQQRLAARITALCDIRHCNPTQSVYAVDVSL
jgi:hypothetical protein